MSNPGERFTAEVNPGKEIAEIAQDFVKPLEVVREALHNAYDAGATEFHLDAYSERLPAGDRVLSLEFRDDGRGMDDDEIRRFFGLGFSQKDQVAGRDPIGFKGHGTKIFYQARQVLVLTQRENGERLLAVVDDARPTILSKKSPEIQIYRNGDVLEHTAHHRLRLAADRGTTIRLVDYTANSANLIDSFDRRHIEDYVRWFTVYGSLRPAFEPSLAAPLTFHLKASDDKQPQPVPFGHPWPESDRTALKTLRELDPRRPYGYFSKRFTVMDRSISRGYRVAIAVLFEGHRGRIARDKNLRRQRAGGIYHERERYGLWLCKDFIPIEPRFEWLSADESPLLEDSFDLNLSQPLVFVNCQDFALTANRGSVGNSSDELLSAVKEGVYDYLREIREDEEYKTFRAEYRDDLFARLREKDRAALDRRIERYNRKKLMRAILTNGQKLEFFEPQREITLFGLIAQIDVLDPSLLGLEILDYDDHSGIDLLVRKPGDPHDLLVRDKVAYAELKFILESQINHPFANLATIVCWECGVAENAPVTDPTDERFVYTTSKGKEDITHAHLTPSAASALKHNIQVIELRRLLGERCSLEELENPRPVRRGEPRPSVSGSRSRRSR